MRLDRSCKPHSVAKKKKGIETFYKRLSKIYHKKGHGLIIYYSRINYPQAFIISQMLWVRNSGAE